MAWAILSSGERLLYGKLPVDLSRHQLVKHFTVDNHLQRLLKGKTQSNQIAYALQYLSTRFLGINLTSFREIPLNIINYLSSQFDNEALQEVLCKGVSKNQFFRFREKVNFYLELSPFSDKNPLKLKFLRWLHWNIAHTNESSQHIFYQSLEWLRKHRVLLPGYSTLERLILYIDHRIKNKAIAALRSRILLPESLILEELLKKRPNQYITTFEQLRTKPTNPSITGLVAALDRLKELQELPIAKHLSFAELHSPRYKEILRYMRKSPKQAISELPPDKRLAYLSVWYSDITITAQEDVLDILMKVIGEHTSNAKRKIKKQRIKTLTTYDVASLTLAKAVTSLLEIEGPDLTRDEILAKHSIEKLRRARDHVYRTSVSKDEALMAMLSKAYSVVCRFLPKLLDSVEFEANERGSAMLESLRWLKDNLNTSQKNLVPPPENILPRRWKNKVIRSDGTMNIHRYTFFVLLRLHNFLKQKAVYLPEGETWGDPHRNIISRDRWRVVGSKHCRRLGLSSDFNVFYNGLTKKLRAAYDLANKKHNQNEDFRIITSKQNAEAKTISLRKLEKLPESNRLIALKAMIASMFPEIDISELILEVDKRLQFSSFFKPISGNKSKIEDLSRSVAAVLLSEACNIGIGPVANEEEPGLRRKRLERILSMYLRSEALDQANSLVVDSHSELCLSQLWGDGSTASADGIRFKVSVNTVHSGLNKKYFGSGRGITYYAFVSDQFTGFYGKVIPGTIRDSVYILDGILQHSTNLNLKTVMSDTAGYSDVIFCLFSLMGISFSPRIADIGKYRLYKPHGGFECGTLREVEPKPVNIALIRSSWDDMLRVVASLVEGKVVPSKLIATLHTGTGATKLARAFAELGKLFRTLHILQYISDKNSRRTTLGQLNLGEGRNGLLRSLAFGGRGQIKKKHLEDQQDQLDALSFVANLIVYWNTLYLQRIVARLRAQGIIIHDEDLHRISPLQFGHINLVGRYFFELDLKVVEGSYRQLRDEVLFNPEVLSNVPELPLTYNGS